MLQLKKVSWKEEKLVLVVQLLTNVSLDSKQASEKLQNSPSNVAAGASEE